MSGHHELADWQDRLEAALNAGGEQFVVRVYQQTGSTQEVAKTFVPTKAVILANQQTAGRGRLGRQWVSSPNACVLMSVVWPTTEIKTLTHDRVSILSGIAVASVTQALLPRAAVRLKWPNDVLIDDKKLAGILIERVADAFIIGIGLNVTSESVSHASLDATSTYLDAHGAAHDLLHVIERLVSTLTKMIHTSQRGELLTQWRSFASLGQTQTFEHNRQRITGEVLDLDPDHGLVIRRDTGEIVTLPAATTSVVK